MIGLAAPLARFELKGFRSFRDRQVIQPHRRLTMLVGPNGSGKSSLLSAMAGLEGSIQPLDVSQDAEPGELEVEARFDLTSAAAEAAKQHLGFPLERVFRRRTLGGESFRFHPEPPAADSSRFESMLEPLSAHRRNCETLLRPLRSSNSPKTEDRNKLRDLATNLAKDGHPEADSVAQVSSLAMESTPFESAVEWCEDHLPVIKEFRPADRGLRDSNPIAVQKNTDAATRQARVPFESLCAAAGLDLTSLSSNNHTDYMKVTRANELLRSRFSQIWGQDRPYPALNLAGSTMQIVVIDPRTEQSNSVARVSDGVRWMIELVSFLAASQTTTDNGSVVLLVDEVEQHLDYDAQVDLMRFLEEGLPNAQIIASTHSIGCWPMDIGRQMNAVSVVSGQSRIANGPYGPGSAGSSGLLEIVGASRAPLASTRKLVFCEGLLDELLLPSVFRAADAELEGVGFVGSTSTSAKRDVGPQDVFLLDGDRGGDRIRQRLVKGGHDDGRIFLLGELMDGVETVEDLFELSIVAEAAEKWAHAAGSLELQAGIPSASQLREWVEAVSGAGAEGANLSSLKRHIADYLLGELGAGRLDVVRTDLLGPLAALSFRINEALKRGQ